MDIIRIHKILEQKKQSKARIEGQLDTYTKELTNLGYANVSAAKKAVNKMEKAIKEMGTAYEIDLKSFEEEYKELLS